MYFRKNLIMKYYQKNSQSIIFIKKIKYFQNQYKI